MVDAVGVVVGGGGGGDGGSRGDGGGGGGESYERLNLGKHESGEM